MGGDGTIEIGDQQGVGFGVMALDCGGSCMRTTDPAPWPRRWAALEKGLRNGSDEQRIDPE
jgi:hypothetical protein